MQQTVLVTGATGFIAKHIALKLLNAGHFVRGSLRSLDRATEVIEALHLHMAGRRDLTERIDFAVLDLARDAGWGKAMDGVDVLMHTASPFPMTQPKDDNDLIRPAVDGTLRALRAAQAAGIKRVILTSSSAAVIGTDLSDGRDRYDEGDWTDPDRPGTTAYTKSKTLAERAAWEFVAHQAPDMQLTTINPVFVLGPPLDSHYGTSLQVIERCLRGQDPMLPQFAFPVVDVRDVAEAHLRALERPETAGHRIIVADKTLWFHEMAEVLKTDHPDRKITTRKAPNALVRVLGLFDPAIRSVLPTLGRFDIVSNARARDMLGLDFISAEDAVRAAGAWLVENDRI